MNYGLLNRFYPLYLKYKEGILYLFFGGVTFFVAMFVFFIFDSALRINPLSSNFFSWLSGVVFSFFTTKKWVFNSDSKGMQSLVKQMALFGGARLATLTLQEVLIYIFVTRLCFIGLFVKLVTEIINIILNYLASKYVIFRRK